MFLKKYRGYLWEYRLLGMATAGLLLALLIPHTVDASLLSPEETRQPDSALPPESACYNLDVIFIVDQSDSMSGLGPAPLHDPNEERVYAPRWAVDWLVDNILGRCTQAFHRIAVISFGTDAQTDLQLTNIKPIDVEDGRSLAERLKNKIQPLALGATDPLEAFQEAANILENAPPIGDAPRKRLVIFLTDGEPCVPERGCYATSDGMVVNNMDTRTYLEELRSFINEHLPFDPVLLEQEKCLHELRDIYAPEDPPMAEISQCYEQHRADDEAFARSTYIWTLLLKQEQPWTAWVREYYVAISEEHGGRVVDLTTNLGDVPGNVARILTQAAGVKVSLLECGAFAVNPYLRSARLSFFKLSESVIVTLSYTDVNGVTHTIQNGLMDGQEDPSIEYRAEGAHEVYVIHYPYPGIWNLQSDACEGSQFYYEPTDINAEGPELNLRRVPQYDLEPCYDPGDPHYIEYQMRDTGGSFIEPRVIPQADDPRFAVHITTTVTDPLGNEQAYEMQWDPGAQLFRSTEPVRVCTAGTYMIDIVGETTYASPPYSVRGGEWPFNQSQVLFSHQDVPFEVLEVVPFEFHIEEPIEGAKITPIHKAIFSGYPLRVKPLTIRVRVTGRDKSELPGRPEDLWAEEGAPFVAIVSAGDQQERVDLHPNPRVPWEYIGEADEIAVAGDYEALVQIVGKQSERYRPDVREQLVTFSRADILFTNPSFYYVLIAIGIVVVIAFSAREYWARQNKLRGSLIFESGMEKIAVISINSGKRWKVLKKEWGSHPELGIKFLRVQHVSIQRERSTDEEIFGPSEAAPPARAIRVTGKTRDGALVEIPELRSGDRVAYSAEVPFTMRYAPPGEEEY